MQSMTGFGRAAAERAGVRVEAEVRTVNQRFFELKLSIPRTWGEHEAEIRKLVAGVVSRGRAEVTLRRAALTPPAARLLVNRRLAAQYVDQMRRLGKQLAIEAAPRIEALLQRPEIFQVIEDERNEEAELRLGFRALRAALKALEAERAREGLSLKRDMARRLVHIEAARRRIATIAEQSRATIIANFQLRVRELLSSPIDERRLYEEASIAAQRADISEELVRLESHLRALGEILGRPGPVGKSIEFLLQEVNREVNTIGSKSQDAALSRLAVDVKGEVEKLREQVQNVE